MSRNQRFFKIGTQWSVVHLPERPNGFGVLIIGDKNNFVEEDSSFWIQNYARAQMLKLLMDKGYTVFYSNLYGTNWGNPDSLTMSTQLYHIIMKQEILNHKIHVLAEGMGALAAIQLMNKMDDKIRSVALLNPCIDLIGHIENERNNKFFYKKLIKELANAYKITDKEVEAHYKELVPKVNLYSPSKSIKIWQSTNEKTYLPSIHGRKYQNEKITLSYHIGENAKVYGQSITQFLSENEDEL
ncbi:hypothetical protein [Fredinandcohnia sp. 179-A 10B2 NHS]|uniref:hypothetical protein n=1 Tax=Fredinandcohnia sp. 179-A 10B2 NHS TaxID=3235176 RepID=UPI0039A302C2